MWFNWIIPHKSYLSFGAAWPLAAGEAIPRAMLPTRKNILDYVDNRYAWPSGKGYTHDTMVRTNYT